MEPSEYVYQVPGDALTRILQACGMIGIFVLCIMAFCGAIVYWSMRMAVRIVAATKYPYVDEIMYIDGDISDGFGLEDYRVDEGITELEKLANKGQ